MTGEAGQGFVPLEDSVFLFQGKYLFMALAHCLSGSRPLWEMPHKLMMCPPSHGSWQ